MVFACQKDSYLKEFTTNVVSCVPGEYDRVINGKPEKITGFEVILEDTVLFPEGGGQPCDYGTINNVPVLQVTRRGSKAIHFVKTPLKEGEEVHEIVDWDRRLDHMQQHSGQHLLTAIADVEFGWVTSSWWLGDEISYVELDTVGIKQEDVDKLEKIINDKIRDGLQVSVSVIEAGESTLDDSRTRGLPKDHQGSVRIITIHGIESNMCCGTHVTNLSQLQAIKILGFEKGKKNKINLNFLVGNRVLKRLNKMYRKELELNLLLKNGPDSHADIIEKLIKTQKTSSKNLQNVLKELAKLEIKNFKLLDPTPKYFYHYKKEAEMDYVNFFIKEFNNDSVLLVLVIGDGTEGQIILSGPSDLVNELGPRLLELLDGKGNCKGGRCQGKFKNFKNLNKAVKL